MTGVGRDGAATPAPAAVAAATDTGRRWPRRCGGPRLEARVADDGRRGTTRIHPPEISEIVGQCVSPAARTPPLDSARRVGDGRRPGYSRWSCARMVSRTCYRLGCGVGDGGCVCGSFEVKRRLWPHFWPAAAVVSGVATAAERDRGTWPLSSSLAAGWPAVVATSTTTEKRTMRVA